MDGKPTVQSEYVACTDYSAGKGGELVCYRWSGESHLNDRAFFRLQKKPMVHMGGLYLHIEKPFNQSSADKITKFLEHRSPSLVRDILDESLIIDIEVKEGSIKTYVAWGGFTITNLIIGYGSLRSGINQAVKDVQNVSNYLSDSLIEAESLNDTDIRYKAKRLGILGKIQNYVRKLNRLDNTDVNLDERQELVKELEADLIEIITQVSDKRDRDLILNETPSHIKSKIIQSDPVPTPVPPLHDTRTLESYYREEEHRLTEAE